MKSNGCGVRSGHDARAISAYWLPAWSLLVLACVVVPNARADTAALKFAWPSDLYARVSFEGARTTEGGGKTTSRGARGSYTITTEKEGEKDSEHLRVRVTEMVVEADGLKGNQEPRSATQGAIQRLIEKASTTYPDYVVDAQGRIVRLDGVKGMMSTLRRGFDELADTLPAARREPIRGIFSRALSESALRARLEEDWHRDIGAWAGASLELGEVYALDASAPAPLLGNLQVPIRVTFEYLGRAGCVGGDATTECVKLRMHSTVDSQKVGTALVDFVQRLAQQSKTKVEVTALTVDQTVRLLTEPGTLLPHAVIVERNMSLEISQGGKVQRRQRKEVRQVRYVYRR